AGVLDPALDGRAVRRGARNSAQRRDFGADADERVVHTDEHRTSLDDRTGDTGDDGAAAVQENLAHGLTTTSACRRTAHRFADDASFLGREINVRKQIR